MLIRILALTAIINVAFLAYNLILALVPGNGYRRLPALARRMSVKVIICW